MDLNLAGKTFIVTGASRGLGYATAEALVADGANVVISGRTSESIEAAARALGPAATAVTADNADPATAQKLVDTALATYGAVHGALISVGGPPAGSALDATDEQWRSAFESVFLGATRIATTTANAINGPGSIVFVLSTSVAQPIAGLAISNGLRPGLAMVAKTLADERGPRTRRANGLIPGRLDTARARKLAALAQAPAQARSRHEATIPLGRYGMPEEFGKVAAFLLSDAASYITGAMLPVDGGLARRL